MNRRDLLLKEMGISQWQLHRPKVFKGAVQIAVAPYVRLLIISDQILDKTNPILKDILLAAQLTEEQYLLLTTEQAQHLSIQHKLIYWFLTDNTEQMQYLLDLLPQAKIWHSPPITKLNQANVKRQLWKDIQTSLLQN